MIRLRITPSGAIHGLWSDELDLGTVGQLTVRRASHVEFDREMQCWAVVPVSDPADTLFHTPSRAAALRWEREHFAPGGAGWPPDFIRRSRQSATHEPGKDRT